VSTIQKSGRSRTDSRRCEPRFLSGRVLSFCVFQAILLLAIAAGAQSEPAQTAAPQAEPANQSHPDQSAAEIASHEEATTFKVNVKLVMVRAVVRDSQGHAIGNLHKEDFKLFDNRKPQIISHFSMEQPGTQVAKERKTSDENGSEKLPSVPERYIAFVFDDVHLTFGDLVQARTAAEHHLATLKPTDRAATRPPAKPRLTSRMIGRNCVTPCFNFSHGRSREREPAHVQM
jgi:hypothetical protein